MCGIFGILSNISLIQIIHIIEKLKHRGKDTFGISYYNNKLHNFKTDKLNNLYNLEDSFVNIKSCITHNRYSTTKQKNSNSILQQAQPIHFKNSNLEFSLVHNGNISNVHKYITYEEDLSDTQNIIQFFNSINENNFEYMLEQFIETVHCSYSIIILYKDILYVLRDRYGYKPLLLGLLNNNYCISSEDCIDDFITIRDVNPGEIIKIDNSGYKTIYYKKNNVELKCIFEFIYFMNPDSTFNNHNVNNIRYKLGQNLASIESIKFDKNNTIVIGSPNTAIPMGEGFATYLNLDYKQLLVKEKDCGRTFILKDQISRQKECKKFIINKELIYNKVIILVDDSLVRGNTLKSLSKLFLSNKCKELHIRICSPKLKYPCFYGIDIPTSEELLLNNYTISEIEKMNQLASLKYISLESMIKSFNNDKFCTACFTGSYNKEIDW